MNSTLTGSKAGPSTLRDAPVHGAYPNGMAMGLMNVEGRSYPASPTPISRFVLKPIRNIHQRSFSDPSSCGRTFPVRSPLCRSCR